MILVEREIAVTFVSCDLRQLEAATVEGIATYNPALTA